MKSKINKLINKNRKVLVFILILIIGFSFRFLNLNWDQNFHLHPDERFLTMVGNAMKIPNTLFEYFNPNISTFNPENLDYSFFVYGIFPLVINKTIAIILNNDAYNSFTIQGRFLSAALDFLIIILVFKSAEVIENKLDLKKELKYFAAFFYAISVFPIQLSHFYTVDTFLNFFMFLSFFFSLKLWETKNFFFLSLSALSTGLAISSKITGAAIIPLNILFISLSFFSIDSINNFIKEIKKKNLLKLFIYFSTYILIIYISLRIFNPYLFQFPSLINLSINESFLESIHSLQSLTNPNTSFPPSLQWIGKPPVLFSLFNLVFFGLGVPIFLLLIIGTILSFTKKKYLALSIISIWFISLFLYQSLQFVQSMRYFLYLYPFFAVFSAFGIHIINKYVSKKITIIILITSLIWPLLFISIYTQPHTRVEASGWIIKNIPQEKQILTEHWDDALPLPIDGKYYETTQLPVFHTDSKQGWQEVKNLLRESDYLILSSGRGYESILNVEKRYPEMSEFYKKLFNNETNYQKVAEFTSYPSLKYLNIPISIPDDYSEEAFRVYDHPKVLIFKNQLSQ